jgi:hypothetical protein
MRKLLPASDKVRIWWGGDVFGHVFDNVVRGFEYIERMPKEVRDKIEVVLCGYGDTYYLLANYVAERFAGAFQLTELGGIAPEDMPSLLSQVDIGFIVFNKWSNFDTYKSPTKMFELMAMGKVVIAERCGEPAHIVSDGIDGFLAEGHDEWAAKLALLVESSALRKAMGRKAKSLIENQYSLEVTMPVLYDIIEGVRHGPKGRKYTPRSFSDIPHRNAASKIAPFVSVQMGAAEPGLRTRIKSWMLANLSSSTTDKLRTVNKLLRI